MLDLKTSYSNEELAFILYNNRSVNGVVSKFFKRDSYYPSLLTSMENELAWCNGLLFEKKTVEIEKSDLILTAPDIEYSHEELFTYSQLIMDSHYALVNPDSDKAKAERDWLLSRGITEYMMLDWKLGSVSYILEKSNERCLEVLGISCHPVLKSLLDDDLSGGGIIFPLFDAEGRVTNCTVRRISDVGKLKYSQSCPDLDVWGLNRIVPNKRVWLTEGILDMMAIFKNGQQAVSVSSAMWSGPQLYKLLMSDLEGQIDIFADNDQVGLRTARILQRFLGMQGYKTRTFISSNAKDPAEHFLQKGLGWDDVVEINITNDMINTKDDMVFNFTKYLKNRKF